MCLGNDSPPQQPQLITPPPPEDFIDFFDEISGTATVTVTENGKKVRKRIALPKTPEQQALIDFAGKAVKDTIENIFSLYRYNPEEAVSYQPFIDRIANLNRDSIQELSAITDLGNIAEYVNEMKQMSMDINDRVFNQRFGDLEANLARSGLSDSTSAREARAAMIREEATARREGSLEAEMAGETLAQARLNRNAQAFGLNEGVRDLQRREAELGYNLEREKVNELDRKRLQAIDEQKTMFGLAQGILGNDFNKQLAGNTTELSNQMFGLQNNANLAYTQAENNRRMQQFGMDMQAYNAQPPGIGQMVLGAGANIAGKMFTSGDNTVAGRAGARVASRFGF
jgi:hypothetical protein